MNYVVIGQPWIASSAGVASLFKLCEDLIAFGQQSRMLFVYPDGTIDGKIEDNEIAIYPDCFCGNPYQAKNVVRYLLMYAGYFGQDRDFPPNELMYYYSPDFILNGRNPENILTIPIVNPYRFISKPQPRWGTCYLAIKYKNFFGLEPKNLPEGCYEIDKKTDLQKLFSEFKKLITFDNSSINLEAAFAGVEVEYRFNEKFDKLINIGLDYTDIANSYKKLKERYYEEQLPRFIEATQKHFEGLK